MRYLFAAFVLIAAGCGQGGEKAKASPVAISGIYSLEVSTSYGVTHDTIEVRTFDKGSNLYQVTHKVLFVKKQEGSVAKDSFHTQTHIATYEEHLGHLQDIKDGTIFRLYHSNEDAEANITHYVRIK